MTTKLIIQHVQKHFRYSDSFVPLIKGVMCGMEHCIYQADCDHDSPNIPNVSTLQKLLLACVFYFLVLIREPQTLDGLFCCHYDYSIYITISIGK